MHFPIILTGFMGAGKSTLAALFSERFHIAVYSTDEFCVRYAGKTIPEIFEQSGESGFRDIETLVLRLTADNAGLHNDRFILDCGGGIILRQENRELLSRLGTVIYLRAKPETILARLALQDGIKERPLLNKPDPVLAVERILAERSDLYEQTADLVVDVDGSTPAETAARIMKLLAGE